MEYPASPSVLPLAIENTEDRSDTRVDADEFVDDFLSEYDDFITLAEDETESEPAPTFDLKAATGFGDDIAKDVAEALGYKDTSCAIRDNCKHATTFRLNTPAGSRGNPNVSIIPESDVYRLIMRANAAHGQQNSTEDRVLMMNKLIQMDEKRFMNGPWEVAVKEVADALQITRDQARTACGPKNDELKARKEAAVLELHKDGKSNTAIGAALGFGASTVRKILERLGGVQTGEYTLDTPSVLPQVNTQPRPDTRVDADEFVDDFLSEYDDYISLSEDETESAPAPTFDLKAATGFGDDKEASLRSPSSPRKPSV
ncbi:hypothetical protein D3C80_682540 [compost metagenome]|uniref:BRO family protein n=1 Tax=Aeromonas rivipollensis TaxID=948519 RepID=UPI000FA9B122